MDERGDVGVVPALDHGHGGPAAVDALEPEVADVVVEDVLRAGREVRERGVVVVHLLQRGRQHLDVIGIDRGLADRGLGAAGLPRQGRSGGKRLGGGGERACQQGDRGQQRQPFPGESLPDHDVPDLS